jgi:predicted dehydrogenase
VNAGKLPPEHWLNDVDEGGGRLLGEGCHFVDFVCWTLRELPKRVTCVPGPEAGLPLASAQRFSITLEFGDGSVATILYTAGGSSRLGKEYLEAHGGGRSAILQDFRSLALETQRRRRTLRRRTQDKGHGRQFEHLRKCLEGHAEGSFPDPLETTAVTLGALRAAEVGRSIAVADLLVPGGNRSA